MKTTVIFEYDEQTRRWEVYVQGVKSAEEAVQAFNAVLVTCSMAHVGMHHKVEQLNICDSFDDVIYKLTIAV